MTWAAYKFIGLIGEPPIEPFACRNIMCYVGAKVIPAHDVLSAESHNVEYKILHVVSFVEHSMSENMMSIAFENVMVLVDLAKAMSMGNSLSSIECNHPVLSCTKVESTDVSEATGVAHAVAVIETNSTCVTELIDDTAGPIVMGCSVRMVDRGNHVNSPDGSILMLADPLE